LIPRSGPSIIWNTNEVPDIFSLLNKYIKEPSEKLPPSIIRISRKAFRNTLQNAITIEIHNTKLSCNNLILLKHNPHDLIQILVCQEIQGGSKHRSKNAWVLVQVHLDINLRGKSLMSGARGKGIPGQVEVDPIWYRFLGRRADGMLGELVSKSQGVRVHCGLGGDSG
jgi:hypothetical protein